MNRKDQEEIRKIEEKWKKFISIRRDHKDDHPSWLSSIERENMLVTLLNILNKYTKKVKVYGID